VSYLNKALKMNFLLMRKQFHIYGFRNIFIVLAAFSLILFATKYLPFLIPEKGVLPFYLLIGTFVILLPLSELTYAKMNPGHKRMLTYFRSVPLHDVHNYYVYRKFTAFIVVVLVVFFPLLVRDVFPSLFVISILGLYQLIMTSAHRFLKNKQKVKILSGAMKYLFIFFCWVIPRNLPDLSAQIGQIPFYHFIICIVLFYGITYNNVKRNNELQDTNLSRKARYSYIKDMHILYILRTDMIAGLLTTLVMSFMSFNNALVDPFGFALTVLISYMMIYHGLLRADQDKVQLFYRPNQLAKIRTDKVLPIIKFSVFYFVLAVGFGLYTDQLLSYLLAYIITTVVFSLMVLLLKINIERGKDEKVTSLFDFVKITAVSTAVVALLVRWL